jgi:hypothetical protein
MKTNLANIILTPILSFVATGVSIAFLLSRSAHEWNHKEKAI